MVPPATSRVEVRSSVPEAGGAAAAAEATVALRSRVGGRRCAIAEVPAGAKTQSQRQVAPQEPDGGMRHEAGSPHRAA